MEYLTKCNAKCVVTKRGNNGGIFVHRYINDDFRLYLLAEYDEYQKMKRYGQIYTIDRESSKSSSILLNRIVYKGIDAATWRQLNPEKEGNIRDDTDYTGLYQHMMMQYLQIVDATLISNSFTFPMRASALECEAHSLIQRWVDADKDEDLETLIYTDLSRFTGTNEAPDNRPAYQQKHLSDIQRKSLIGMRSGEYRLDKDGIYRNSEGFIEILARF